MNAIILISIVFFFVLLAYAIATWREVRNYQTDKHYDALLSEIASRENMMRPSGELTKQVTQGIKQQYGGNSNY